MQRTWKSHDSKVIHSFQTCCFILGLRASNIYDIDQFSIDSINIEVNNITYNNKQGYELGIKFVEQL